LNELVLLPVDKTLRNLINLIQQNVFRIKLVCAIAHRESQSSYFWVFGYLGWILDISAPGDNLFRR